MQGGGAEQQSSGHKHAQLRAHNHPHVPVSGTSLKASYSNQSQHVFRLLLPRPAGLARGGRPALHDDGSRRRLQSRTLDCSDRWRAAQARRRGGDGDPPGVCAGRCIPAACAGTLPVPHTRTRLLSDRGMSHSALHIAFARIRSHHTAHVHAGPVTQAAAAASRLAPPTTTARPP
jgi:hypothetical protein